MPDGGTITIETGNVTFDELADAYGEAIDVNPVENPYLLTGKVHPRAGAGYLNRGRVRPGMAVTPTAAPATAAPKKGMKNMLTLRYPNASIET